MVEKISQAQARRIALAAQGFGRPAPATVGTRQLNALIDRLNLLQLDSVNVFERSHYLPAFARLGAYDRSALDRLTFAPRGRYVEYWAHEAAIIPVQSWPLLRWRMQRYRQDSSNDLTAWSHANREILDWVLAEVAEKGPLPASRIEHDANKRTGPWWGHSPIKTAMEVLFRWGDLVSAGRTRFERTYALPEHVLPADVLARDVPGAQARTQLMELAARAHGIGTASDLADYFRLKAADAKPALAELQERGVLIPVTVAGWDRPGLLHRDARIPRHIEATAMLSPFDPVVWDRRRAERLFGFHYRIEIYTPAAKRIYGYYSLPILVDDRLVGRIDLKSDRQNSTLRVQSAWVEPGEDAAVVAERLAPLLTRTAAWQGLSDIAVTDRGDLAGAIAGQLGGWAADERNPGDRGRPDRNTDAAALLG